MITPGFSLTATERVLPRLALDFTTASLDPRVTFTRTGNTATVVNSLGYIATINANLPRFDFDPSTLVCKGLLIEESRTNLISASSGFSGGFWGDYGSAGTVTLDATGPDNTISATTFDDTSTSAVKGKYSNIGTGSLAVTSYTASIFVKKGTSPTFMLWVIASVQGTIFQDTLTWTGGIPVGSGWTAQAYANGFYRVYKTFSSTSVQTANLYVIGSTFPDTGSTIFYGTQVEAGTFPTSYIPTTTQPLTRNADVATMTGTNFSDWFNQPQGSFMARFAGAVKTSTWAFQMDSGGGNFTNRIACSPGTNNNLIISNAANVNQCTLGDYNGVDNVFVNITGSYNTDNFATSYNGTSAILDNSGTPSLPTAMIIGARNTASPTGFLNSWIQKFYYWPQQLTNAEVQAFSK
jgi:hypothetical protein